MRPAAEGEQAGARRTVTATLGTLDAGVNAAPFADAFGRAGLTGLADGRIGDVRGVTVGGSGGEVAAQLPPGSLVVALDGLPVAGLDDLWVRVARAARTGTWLRVPPTVVLTAVPPGGGDPRDVELRLR